MYFEHFLFPNKVGEYVCEGFDIIKNSLIDYIFKIKENQSSYTYTVVNGWQSGLDEYAKKDFQPFLAFFNQNIQKCLESYGIDLEKYYFELSTIVFNVNCPESYQELHVHPEAHLSGVFWIEVPNDGNGGDLVFKHPESFSQHKIINCSQNEIKKKQNIYDSYTFYPKNGHMIMFPPNLSHCVTINLSNKNRISVGYNILLHEKLNK